MTALYDRMDSLPPRLQMFMAGCRAELEAKRQRINCRQVVMRTVLALAEGVRRTAYWNLAPAVAATVTDAFGRTRTAASQDGRIRLPVGTDPLFVAAR